MPGEDGLSFVRSREGDATPMLMLTAMGESTDRIEGLEAGARDYLAKPFEPKELVLRLNNLLRDVPKREKEVRFGRYRFDLKSVQLECDGEPVRLTDSERHYLQLLCEHANKTVSRARFTEAISEVSDRSIDVQINRLRKKIETDSARPDYIQTVRGEGYILRTKT